MIAHIRKILGICTRGALRAVCLIAVLPVLWILEAFYPVRIGTMYFQRIGHLAANTDIFFRRIERANSKRASIYFLVGYDYANRQLLTMFQRAAPPGVWVIDSKLWTRVVFAWRRILSETRFWERMDTDYGEYKLFTDVAPRTPFTPDEEKRGEAALHALGIGHDDWFVAFHARDGAYLRQWRPELESYWQGNDWRNNDVDAYGDALHHITGEGGYAIRFGAVVDGELPKAWDPRIIDYPNIARSEFMDIYLAAKCRFFLGTASGPAWVPTVFGVPTVVVDHVPYSHSRPPGDLIIPRPIVRHEDNKPVTFFEAAQNGFFVSSRTTSPRDAENLHLYTWGSCDSQDILDGCLDMLDQLEGRPVDEEARSIQTYYADTYLSHLPDYELAAKISPRWAKRHRQLIVGE